MNLLNILQESNYDFFFIGVDDFLSINVPELKNFYTLNPKNLDIKIDIKNSGVFLSNPKVIEYIKKKSTQTNHQVVIIPFKPSGKIEHICQKENWIYAANPAKLNRFLEDKINFSNLCQKFNFPTIPSVIDDFNQQNFQKYQQILNNNLVIQTRFGWAGKSTFHSSSWEEIENKIPIDTPVKFAPLLSGYSLINNCCLTSKGLIQSPPGLQYTGLSQFTPNPFTTVGRQWPSYAPVNVVEKIRSLTQRFSDILKVINYRGFFGLDFFISKDEVFILECNPRLTASFELYHQIETKNNLNSLFLFHLFSFLPLKIEFDISQEIKRFYNPAIIGSEITKKDKFNNTCGRYRDFIPFSLQSDPIDIAPSIIKSANETDHI